MPGPAPSASPPHRLNGLLARRAAGAMLTVEQVLAETQAPARWMGWRMRLLVSLALGACLVVAGCAWWLAQQPHLPVTLKARADGHLSLQSVDYPTLRKLEGLELVGLRVDPPAEAGPAQPLSLPADMVLLQRSARWLTEEAERRRFLAFHQQIDAVRQHWRAEGLVAHLRFAHAAEEPVLIAPRGWSGLTLMYWVLSGLALAVFMVGASVLLSHPTSYSAAYALLTTAQSAQLMLMAVGGNLDFFAPGWMAGLDLRGRMGADLATAAALLYLGAGALRRRAWLSPVMAVAGVALAVVAVAGFATPSLLVSTAGWWTWQALCAGGMAAALLLMHHGQRTTPHPFGRVVLRFAVVGGVTWGLIVLALVLGGQRPDLQLHLSWQGVMVWHVFVGIVLLLCPYLSRTKQVLQEFSLLAVSSTVAASLDLLFVAVFSLGQFTSMTLSLFLALGSYLLARRWMLTQLPGRDALSMERLFQHLYRMARELEGHPDRLDDAMLRLMRELFDPLESEVVRGHVASAAVRGNGALLLLPMPRLGDAAVGHRALALRHAHKGLRLFTVEDARLAERIIEQLQRALNFDRAVEQGRSEERLRIAQDLHDDIGARLLTLMYQAPNAEIEEYIRHTLQDLKTLTRGLAAQSHCLVEAAGEWKRDLQHRADVAECRLDFDFAADVNVTLTMVQWSALTRILRELVSNALSHARARHIVARLKLAEDQLTLEVQDNGIGRAPEEWSQGLGMGGVRKRVKQLGGQVRWEEASPCGIRCVVTVAPFASPPAADQTSH